MGINQSPNTVTFQPGDRVVITEGAFAGMNGCVVTDDEAQEVSRREAAIMNRPFRQLPERTSTDSCCVVLTIFGREVPLEMKYSQLRHSLP